MDDIYLNSAFLTESASEETSSAEARRLGVVPVTADPVIGASDYDRRQVTVELALAAPRTDTAGGTRQPDG